MNCGENGRNAYFIGERVRRKKKDKRMERKMLYEHLFCLALNLRRGKETSVFILEIENFEKNNKCIRQCLRFNLWEDGLEFYNVKCHFNDCGAKTETHNPYPENCSTISDIIPAIKSRQL